ncbi:MAG: ROK family protein [Phycisphaerales bacterium]|nr:ROK family protein [Phycisphaerales bacterium]
MSDTYVIGIDLGGTETKGALVDRNLKIMTNDVCATPAKAGPDVVIAEMGNMFDRLAKGRSIAAVGIGCPGPLSPSRGIVFNLPNMPGWKNVALRDRFAECVSRPVVIENDANAAAYGEYRGGGWDVDGDMVLLTLGTGVGSGTIINGRVFGGTFETASEWGHVIVQPDGPACGCGQRGCLEAYASANAVAERVRLAVNSGTESSLAENVRRGETITSRDVEKAMRGGDALAERVWDEACRYLGLACVAIQHAINPRYVLLGGGMSAAGAILVERVRRHYDGQRWHMFDDAPTIELARLGNTAGVIGAAALAWDLAARPQ